MRYTPGMAHAELLCGDPYQAVTCQKPRGHRDARHVHEVIGDGFYRRTVVRTWPNLAADPVPVEADGPYEDD